MTPYVSLLLLLLLGLSQAQPVKEEGSNAVDEEAPVDISTRILSSNNGSKQILLEGDLVAPKSRNAMKCWSQSCLWPKGSNGLVVIPYTISNVYDNWERDTIEYAMQSFHSTTCIRFVPRTNEYDYIMVENGDGCYSSLGKEGYGQVLSINRQGCVYYGVVQHEIMHAELVEFNIIKMSKRFFEKPPADPKCCSHSSDKFLQKRSHYSCTGFSSLAA
eukprot:XP_003979107.1 PREDICTED: high choriolytic enzyme 1-like [Takifugu rubripes]